MFKKILALIFCVLTLSLIAYCKINHSTEKSIIAITQIAPHPSLDRIREGIMDTLKATKRTDIQIIFENAFGNISTATQIAQRFASLNPKVIVPITTPSAQTVQTASSGKQTPIVFVAITDPVQAHFANPNGTNIPHITGISDAPPYLAQAKQMITLTRKKNITVGILYNPGEANSISQIKEIEKELQKFGGKIILSPATSTVSVNQAVSYLVGKVDAIYLPNDNTVVSALTSVLKITHTHKIPVFSSDPESVKAGCTAAVAPDQYAIGVQAAKMIIRILNGEKTDTIPVEKSLKINEYVNEKVSDHMVLGSPQPQ
ncbi:MAG: ABC transporter substrate-binding protein [Candidatus Paracaedibacteraceae bacterium]|nr:ABC transporter substrate-binding protein [Candidatus Paracaedibacteraceae bacterium]